MTMFSEVPLSVLVLVLGGICFLISSSLAGTRVWPVLLYWIGWTVGIYGAETLSGDGVMPVFTDANRQLLLQLHLAAAVGFVIACMVFHLGRGALGKIPIQSSNREREWHLQIHPRLITVAFLIQLALGAFLLFGRFQEIGQFSVSSLLADVRASYLREAGLGAPLSPMVRLGSHAANFLVLFPFLFGVQDALERRIHFRRVLLWWMCSIPGGISTGGRGWIVTTPVVYFIAFLVTSADGFEWRRAVRLTLRAVPVVLGLALLFSAVEKGRQTNDLLGGLKNASWYNDVPAGKAVVYYLGLPILGVDAYTEYAAQEQPYNGTLTFDFFAAQLQRLKGGVARTAGDFNVASRSAMFFGPYPILFATHVPVIPNLVGDFGLPAYPYVFAAICFACVLAYLVLRGGGIVAKFIAVTITMGLFWSFQSLMLGSAGMLLPIGWLVVLVGFDALLRNAHVYERPMIALREESSTE